MQNIGIIEASGTATVSKYNRNPILRVIGKNKASNHVPETGRPLRSIVNDVRDEDIDKQAVAMEFDEDQHGDLRVRFVRLLTAHCKTLIPLTDIVSEMIAADVDRDDAIEWGIEAGLSDSYVRATVSRLYTQLTGERVKAVGGGRKQNPGAPGLVLAAMKASRDDVKAAKALLLAARRLLESWEAAGTVEQNMKALRSPAK